jgi:hypothetical protein
MWMSLGARLVEAAELETLFLENLDMVFLANEGSVTTTTLHHHGTVITSAIKKAVPDYATHNQYITTSQNHLLPLTGLTMTVRTPVLLRSTL